jgi:hypothetical protein
MDYPTMYAPPVPAARNRQRDPLAVAIGNASLLNIGYLMLGRRLLALFTGLVTITLVVLLATVARSVWFEIVVVIWWLALIGHGWRVAGGRARRNVVRWQRVVATTTTVTVLVAVGLLRFDAAGIEQSVTEARQNGNCAQAMTALNEVWFGHRIADAPLTARLDQTDEACRRIATATGQLSAALKGNLDGVPNGFTDLATVLAQLPGHQQMVRTALDSFLGGLSRMTPCQRAAITDVLRLRQVSHTVLDRALTVVPELAPAALVGCGDDLVSEQDWTTAQSRYQELLDRYPQSPLADRARQGVTKATLALQLAKVNGLLSGETATQPDYCTTPAPYGAAPAYTKGQVNPALIYGNDDYANRLPAGWRATDATNATLVVCAGGTQNGDSVRTCPYQNKVFPQYPIDVTFHKIAIPVKAYELRTGALVVDTTVQISGSSCPETVQYESYDNLTDLGPPSDMAVTATDAQVAAGFAPVINP